MAGLYLHIPFCKQACHYCNFHFSTSLRLKGDLVKAILVEIEAREKYLSGVPLKSIYLGGGTPSLLSGEELGLIFNKIYEVFSVEQDAEITLEANPDDLDPEKINQLKNTPVNRLSIGVQSFFQEDLKAWNRAHSAEEAISCIKQVQKAGFDNLTVDLIYGSPTTSHDRWRKNVQQLIDFDIPHLSCYALTVEEKTALGHFVRKGKVEAPKEAHAAEQFEILMEMMVTHGYDHYEISNFAKPGYYAIHNSSYWKGAHYLGIGPAAHSFNGHSRSWNIANNAKYIKAVTLGEESGIDLYETENLTLAQRYNEYILTGLRTIWGCSIAQIGDISPDFKAYFQSGVIPFIENGQMAQKGDTYYLTSTGKLLADFISAELFVEE